MSDKFSKDKNIRESLSLSSLELLKLLPRNMVTSTDKEQREKNKKIVKDLIVTLNKFYKDHNIDIQYRNS